RSGASPTTSSTMRATSPRWRRSPTMCSTRSAARLASTSRDTPESPHLRLTASTPTERANRQGAKDARSSGGLGDDRSRCTSNRSVDRAMSNDVELCARLCQLLALGGLGVWAVPYPCIDASRPPTDRIRRAGGLAGRCAALGRGERVLEEARDG